MAPELASYDGAAHLRVPDGLELHLIRDNYATRKTPAIKKWLLRHRRFHQQSSPYVCRSRFPAGPAG